MTTEEYQEAIDMNPDQLKAWRAFERAVKKCQKENVFFYQVLETIAGLNGHNVKNIHSPDRGHGPSGDDPSCMQRKDIESIWVVCGFADDAHFIELHEDYDPLEPQSEGGADDD